MAIPRRRPQGEKTDVLLDASLLENVEKVKLESRLRSVVSADPQERLRAMEKFTPHEQRTLRPMQQTVLAEVGVDASLDLPELSEDEKLYLDPEEQRQTRLLRAYESRGVQTPTLTLPIGAPTREVNDELERILRQNTGVLIRTQDTPMIGLKAALAAVGWTADKALKLEPVPGVSVGEALRTTEAATATVLAAAGLDFGVAQVRTSQELQLKRLKKSIVDEGLGSLLAVGDDSPIVKAYETTDYPTGIKPLIAVVDPTNWLPITVGGKVVKTAAMVKAATAGELAQASTKILFDEAVSGLRDGRLFFEPVTGRYFSLKKLEPTFAPTSSLMKRSADILPRTSALSMLISTPKRPMRLVYATDGKYLPLSVPELVEIRSFDQRLPEKLMLENRNAIWQASPDLRVYAGDEAGFVAKLHGTEKQAHESAMQKLSDWADPEKPVAIEGAERVRRSVADIVRDIEQGDNLTAAMNTAQVYMSYSERLALAEAQYASKFQKAWRWMYRDPVTGQERAVVGPMLRAVHFNRYKPQTQTLMSMLVNAKGGQEVVAAASRYRLAEDFDAVFNYNRSKRAFKSPLPEPKTPVTIMGTNITVGTEGNKAQMYSRYLDLAMSKQWLTKEEADWYRVFDMFQNRDDYNLPQQVSRFFGDVDKKLAENHAIELRQATGLDVKEIANSYLPHWWENPKGLVTDRDPLGNAIFSREQKIAVWGREDFEFKREFPHMRLAVMGSIDKALKEAQPNAAKATVLRINRQAEHPMDLVSRRIYEGQMRKEEKIFLSELKKQVDAGVIGGDEAKDARALMAGHGIKILESGTRITDEIRALRFGLDLGVLGVQAALGTFPYMLMHPVWTIKTYHHALVAMMDDPGRWVIANQDRLLRAKRVGLEFGAVARDIRGKAAIEKIGGKYNPVSLLNDIQFNRILTAIKVDHFELTSAMLSRNSPVNRAIENLTEGRWKRQGLSGFEADRRAAKFSNALFGGLNKADYPFAPGVVEFSKFLLNTPQFFIGTLQVALSAAKPGVDGMLARAFLLRLYATSAALVSLVNSAQGETSELVNIDDPDWMMIKIGNVRISPLGRFRAYAKLVYQGVTDVENFVSGGVDPIETDTKALQFALGRASVLVQAGVLVGTQRGFMGEPMFVDSGPTLRTKETWSVMGQQLLSPISLGQSIEDIKAQRATTAGLLANFFGITAYTLDPTAERVKQVYAEEVAKALADSNLFGDNALSLADAKARAEEAARLSRPMDAFLIPGTNQRLPEYTDDIGQDITTQVALRMGPGFMKPAGKGGGVIPDTDLTRRLGEAKKRTAAETKAFEKAIIENWYDDKSRDSVDRMNAYDAIQRLFDDRQVTLEEALEMVAKVDYAFRFTNFVEDEYIKPLFDKYRSKRIQPSEREVLFEQWMQMLDRSIDDAGRIDWRQRTEDERSIMDHPLFDEFEKWREADDSRYPWIKRLRNQLLDTLSPYFEATLPKSMGGEVPDEAYRYYHVYSTETSSQKKMLLLSRMPENVRSQVFVAELAVEARRRQVRVMNPTVEVALWVYYGTKPINPQATALIQMFSRGTELREDAAQAIEASGMLGR